MRRILQWLPVLLAATLLPAGCGGRQETADLARRPAAARSVAGIHVADRVSFARESMEESRILAALIPRGPAGRSVIPLLAAGARRSAGGPAGRSPAVSGELPPSYTPSRPFAPALSGNFAGLPDTGDVIPPDTMGAVGPDTLLETLNSEVAAFDKASGTSIPPVVSLSTFWTSVRNGLPPFDPKSLYDTQSGRFIFSSLAGSIPPDTRLLIAISTTDNAAGEWNKFGIAANRENGAFWADFDSLGVDDNSVYVTANMFDDFDNFQYVKVWVFPKAQLIAGSLTSWTEFPNPAGAEFTVQPAHTLGPSSAEYLVHEGYLTVDDPPAPPAPPHRFVRLSSITGPADNAAWTDLGFIEVATYPDTKLPGAPQKDAPGLIDTGDQRLLNAVSIGGSVWTTHTVSNSANTKTEVAWYRIDPADANPDPSGPYRKPVQQGRMSDAIRFHYYPSIAVNAGGDAALAFGGSSSAEYVSAFYTGRSSSDPDNTMQSVGLLKAGLASYSKDFGSGSIRWGDYNATSVDPSDNTTFWTVQEYAASPADTWATRWGTFRVSADTVPNAPLGLSAATDSQTQITLSWIDNSSNETAFNIERKTGATGTYAKVGTARAGATAFSDAPLAADTTYFYRVRAANALGESAPSNEVSATTTIRAPSAPAGGGGGGCTAAGGSSGDAGSSLGTAAAFVLPLAILALRRRRE